MPSRDLLRSIKMLVLDIDGVLTDGTVLVTESGEQLRRMSIKDGYALKKAINNGLIVAVISGGSSEGPRKRLNALGIDEVHLGVAKKLPVLQQLCDRYSCTFQEVAYIGDDVPDTPVMEVVGLSACPADAEDEVFSFASYVCKRGGGAGCVREVIKMILVAKDQCSIHS